MTRLQYALIATIAWGALAFGAVYPWWYWPMALSALGIGIATWIRSRPFRDPRLRTLAIALALVAVAMAVQLVPLPYGVIMAVSPGVDAFLRQDRLGYQRPAWHALSIDPGLTAVALTLFLALAVLLIGLTRAIRHMRLDWLMTQLLGLGLGLAVFGIVQKALTDETDVRVYGFWEPMFGGNPFGPFVNRNHFAGWMLMAMPPVVGHAIGELLRAPRPRVGSWRIWLQWITTVDASRFLLSAFGALSMALSVVLTGSRSGVAGLAIVTLVLGYHIVRRLADARARLVATLSTATILVGVLLWAGPREIVGRFAETATSVEGRFTAWRDTWQIILDFSWFGTGLGTYGQSMLVYQTAGRPEIYLQAHNDYIQLAAEGGVLVGVPIAILAAVMVRTIWRRMSAGEDGVRTMWIRIGAVAGLLGIAAQSLVEFSLQMPGNALLFTVVAALAMHRPARSSRAHRV